jgi:PAS domain-containing protein
MHLTYNRRNINLLIMIIFLAVVAGMFVTLTILYSTALDQERQRLRETAQSQASLLGAVARFDRVYSNDYPTGSLNATLHQMQDAHSRYEGFGRTGEFTLAKEENGMIVFLLNHRSEGSVTTAPIPMDSILAEPMRQALMGNSGTMIGLDYRGVNVLAAYEPVPDLGMGIVAKIDMAEIQGPYVRAGMISTLAALIIALAGAVLSHYLTSQLEDQIVKNEKLYRTLVEAMNDGLVMKDSQGVITFANPSFCNMLGYSHEK